MVRFNYFAEHGAFTRDAASGRYRVDALAMREAVDALSGMILTLQGDGDYESGSGLSESRGVIGPQLRADLERLAAREIPVDVVFRAGQGGARPEDGNLPGAPEVSTSRAHHRGAAAGPRRLRGAAAAAGGRATDDRSVHLLRSHGRRCSRRARARRAAAPAHRPRHGDLPVRRRDPASRQPRHRCSRSGRARELDDRRRAASCTPSARRRNCARPQGSGCYGVQTWVALPGAHEETDAAFVHYPAQDLPVVAGEGSRLRLLAGEGWGVRSPVARRSPTCSSVDMVPRVQRSTARRRAAERAIYVVEGRSRSSGDGSRAGELLSSARAATSTSGARTRRAWWLLGGAPLDGTATHLVEFRVELGRARIERAKEDWRERAFRPPVPGDPELIPLPEA